MTRRVLPLLLLLCLSTARSSGAPLVIVQPSVEVPEEVIAVLDAYSQAWKAGDSRRLAALFTDDGMALPNGGVPAQGADAISATYAHSAGGPLHLRPIAYQRDGNLAMVVGAFGAAPDQEVGKFVLVLRHSADGTWKIVADIDNLNQRPRPQPVGGPSGT